MTPIPMETGRWTTVHRSGTEDTSVPERRPPADAPRSSIERLAYSGRVARFVGGTTSVFALSLVIGLALMALGPALLLRWNPVVITSGSMKPTIEPGDIVLGQPATDLELRPGAIAIFRDDGRDGDLVTHRVVSADDGRYQTKGDANRNRDSVVVERADVIGAGRLVVPMVGSVVLWLRQGDWTNVILVAAGAVFCAYTARFALLPQYDPWALTPAMAGATSDQRIQSAERPFVAIRQTPRELRVEAPELRPDIEVSPFDSVDASDPPPVVASDPPPVVEVDSVTRLRDAASRLVDDERPVCDLTGRLRDGASLLGGRPSPIEDVSAQLRSGATRLREAQAA